MSSDDINLDDPEAAKRLIEVDYVLPKEILDAFELYSVLVDINSIEKFPTGGWPIYGRKKENGEPENWGRSTDGIVIGIFGEQKCGKTWLNSKLVGKPLKHAHTINTSGIGVLLPEERQERVIVVDRGGGGGNRRGGRVPPRNIPVTSAKRELIFLDFAGSNAPCNKKRLKDLRCTESLIREILLGCSDHFIYVTSKFLRPSQIELNNIVKDLEDTPKKIDQRHKLIVVHNLLECTSKKVLRSRIAECKRVYQYNPENRELKTNMIDDDSVWDEFDHPCQTPEFAGTIKIFSTQKHHHIFLVRDPRDDKQFTDLNKNETWRRQHNMRAFHFIETQLRLNIARCVSFNLLKSILSLATNLLPNYSEVFSPDKNMHLVAKKLPDYPPALFPKKKMPPTTETTQSMEPTATTASEFNADGYWLDDWSLRGLEFINNRATTTAIFKGGYKEVVDAEGKKRFRVCVEMPGVTSIDSISIKRNAKHQVTVEATRESLDPSRPPVQAKWVKAFDHRNTFSSEPSEAEIKASPETTLAFGIFTFHLSKLVADVGVDSAVKW